MSIEVANESGAPIDEAALVALARHVLAQQGIHPQAELSVLLVGVDAMSALHEQWMDESGPTDVLAFPMDELRPAREDREPQPGLLGDVVLCPAVAATQAAEHGRSTEGELHLLCMHGILHLLGYDHSDADEQREMFALQEFLLDGWQRARDATATVAAPVWRRIPTEGGAPGATTPAGSSGDGEQAGSTDPR